MPVYSVGQLWVDTLENHNAYGYEIIGYTTNEELVKLLKTFRLEKAKYPYPLNYIQNQQDTVPQFEIKELPHLNSITDIDLSRV